MNDSTGPSGIDYLVSHLQRGDHYDETLASNPYDAFMTSAETALLERIVPDLFEGKIGRYLDFACGTGRITEVVARHAEHAVGVDISDSMLGSAREKNPDIRFLQADLTRESHDLGTFDLITSFRFFGNAEDGLRDEVLGVIARLLCQDGYLIINGHRNPYALSNVLHVATGGKNELTLSWWHLKRLLQRHGLVPIQMHGIGGWLYRHGLRERSGDPPAWAGAVERLMRRRPLAPFCPDFLVVAWKP